MSDYWVRRREKLLGQMEKDEQKLNARLADLYASERAKLEREIAAYYARYGEDGVIAYRSLLGSLDPSDRKLLIERMDDFARKYPQHADLMPVRASIYRLNELEGIQASILMRQLEIGAVEQSEVDAHLKEQALRSANLAAEEMGFGSSFYTVDSQVVTATVGASWAEEGGFSAAIWANRRKLAAYLNDDFAKLVARGATYEQCARELGERFEGVSKRDAKRLVYTEGTFVFNEAHAQVHEKDFDRYALSCADSRACAACRQVQAAQTAEPERFENRKPGVNFPPLHPWCRCSYTVEVADWGEWLKRQTVGADAVERGISAKKSQLAGSRVDLDYVKSSEYRRKFDALPLPRHVRKAIADACVASLVHRNGTAFEDLTLVSLKTGEVSARSARAGIELESNYTDNVKRAIASAGEGELFAIHNHPSNIPPTGSDFVASGSNRYGGAVVCLHNGEVFYYNHGNVAFMASSFDGKVNRYVEFGMSEYNAIVRAMGEFERSHGIKCLRL